MLEFGVTKKEFAPMQDMIRLCSVGLDLPAKWETKFTFLGFLGGGCRLPWLLVRSLRPWCLRIG